MSANPAIAASDAEVLVVASADGQAAFDFDFPIYAADQIVVYRNGVLQSSTLHYSVSGQEVADGGTVTFEAAVAAAILEDDAVLIRRETPIVRNSKYSQTGDFRSYTVNRDFDLLIMICQELTRDVDGIEVDLTAETAARILADLGFASADLGHNVRLNALEHLISLGGVNITGAALTLVSLQAMTLGAGVYVPLLGRAAAGDDGGGVFVGTIADMSATLVRRSLTSSLVVAATDIITIDASLLTTGMVAIATAAVDGLAVNTPYWIKKLSSTTIQLAASAAALLAGTMVDLTAATNVTLKILHDPLQGLYVIPAGFARDGSQGCWIRTVRAPLDPAWFGAKGDLVADDTDPWRACANIWKSPDLTLLPDTPGVAADFRVFEFRGREIDGRGRQYSIYQPISIDLAYGIEISNATLVAAGALWTAGQAVIEGLNAHILSIHDLTIEGNQKANGIHIDRPKFCTVRDVGVFGCGLLEFGFKLSTAFGGLEAHLNNLSVYGQIGSAGTNDGVPPGADFEPVAVGILITGGSDSSMIDCKANRFAILCQIETGGWRVTNCHFTGGLGSRPGLYLPSNNQFVRVGLCTFDHSYIHIVGSPRVEISDCTIYNTVDDLQRYAVLLEASAANQIIQNIHIWNCFAKLDGNEDLFEFIRLVEAGGFFYDGVAGSYIKDNAATGDSQFPETLFQPRSTEGMFDLDVEVADFSGTDLVIDLSDYILLPSPPVRTPRFSFIAAAMTSGVGSTFKGSNYVHATGLLTTKWSATFDGRLVGRFMYGDQYERPVL